MGCFDSVALTVDFSGGGENSNYFSKLRVTWAFILLSDMEEEFLEKMYTSANMPALSSKNMG